MKITLAVLFAAEDARYNEIDVSPETTLGSLKNQLVVMLPEDHPQQSWYFSYRESILPQDDSHTLQQAGVADGDMVQAIPQSMLSQNQPSLPRSSAAEPNTTRVRERVESIRQQILNNPQARADIVARYPQIASTLNDPTRFRIAWVELIDKSNADAAAEDARLNDVLNEENQAKIYERIRMDKIEKDHESVMEQHPELLGRVSMLYVNLLVNGHPVKAFVDSGAQATIISPSCAEACGITHLIDPRYSGIARGVGTARILGRIHKAPFKLAEFAEDEICCFTVMEGKDVDILLGLDMLRRYQATIDLAGNKLVLGGESVSFLPESEIPKFMEEEPVVEGPAGTSIGARSGALKPPESSGGPAGQSAGSTSSSAQQSASSASTFSGAGRTLGATSASSAAPPASRRAPTASPVQAQPQAQQPPMPSRPSAPTPSRAAAPPQASIDVLQEYTGATREQAIEALAASGGNVDAAAAFLFESL